MLSEEGLILLVAFGACALVALGALELVWPTRPRHPVRRRAGAPEGWRRPRPPASLPPRPTPTRARVVTAPLPVASETRPVELRSLPGPLAGSDAPDAAGLATLTAPVSAVETSTAMPADAPPPATTAARPTTAAATDEALAAPSTATDEALAAPSTVRETPAIAPDESAVSHGPATVEASESTAEASPAVAAAREGSEIAPDAPPAPPAGPARVFPPPLRIVPREGRERVDPRAERPRGPRPRPLPRPARPPAPRPFPEPPRPEPVAAMPAQVGETIAPGGESGAERCLALIDAGRLAEAARLAEEALASRKSSVLSAPSPASIQETARLWGVVGLAKQGLADFDGARFAFEEAIAVAPRAERPTWERRLVDLALLVGAQSLGEDDQPRRVESLRTAIDWLERGLAVAPEHDGLKAALAATREALWPTYETAVKALVQKQDFVQARHVLDEVLVESGCPTERRSAFRRLYASAISAEVEQATERALRHVQGGREDEATAALAHAEGVLATTAGDVLGARRREDIERRLWTAYATLGHDRLEAGARETAMSLLFRALSFTTIAADRQEETRALLVRTLDEFVAERSVEIGRLIDAGDYGAATAQSDKLWTLLRGAVDQALSEDDVLGSFDKVLGLYRRMGGKRA